MFPLAELALAAVVGADRWPGCGWYVHRSVWADFADDRVAGAGDLDRMAASADRVWDLASDITRVWEISPETFEAEWPGGASGPEVGARFRGHVWRNGRGPVYWTVCTVVACDPGREFAFVVAGPGGMTTSITSSYATNSNTHTILATCRRAALYTCRPIQASL